MKKEKYELLLKLYLRCRLDPKYYCLFICVRNIAFNFQYKFLPVILFSLGKKGVLK